MIVVADTSVVLNLCRVEHDQLLRTLFGRVLVPVEVAFEFDRVWQRFEGDPEATGAEPRRQRPQGRDDKTPAPFQSPHDGDSIQ